MSPKKSLVPIIPSTRQLRPLTTKISSIKQEISTEGETFKPKKVTSIEVKGSSQGKQVQGQMATLLDNAGG